MKSLQELYIKISLQEYKISFGTNGCMVQSIFSVLIITISTNIIFSRASLSESMIPSKASNTSISKPSDPFVRFQNIRTFVGGMGSITEDARLLDSFVHIVLFDDCSWKEGCLRDYGGFFFGECGLVGWGNGSAHEVSNLFFFSHTSLRLHFFSKSTKISSSSSIPRPSSASSSSNPLLNHFSLIIHQLSSECITELFRCFSSLFLYCLLWFRCRWTHIHFSHVSIRWKVADLPANLIGLVLWRETAW